MSSSEAPWAALYAKMRDLHGEQGGRILWLAWTGQQQQSAMVSGQSADVARRALPAYELKPRSLSGVQALELKAAGVGKLLSYSLFQEGRSVEIYCYNDQGEYVLECQGTPGDHEGLSDYMENEDNVDSLVRPVVAVATEKTSGGDGSFPHVGLFVLDRASRT